MSGIGQHISSSLCLKRRETQEARMNPHEMNIEDEMAYSPFQQPGGLATIITSRGSSIA